MQEFLFPYENFRKSQKEFLLEVDNAIKSRKCLITHAPTGSGKSVSTIAPALKYCLEKDSSVFFLTNRHTQHEIVIKTLKEIKEKHKTNFLIADFIGKKHMCGVNNIENLSSREFYEYCKDAREKDTCGFYINFKDKIKKPEISIILEKIKEKNPIPVKEVIDLCEEFCSFEINCEFAKKSNLIVLDYFHILNPIIRDSFLLRINKLLGNSILIFDEAHNIAKRARELLTDNLSTYTLEIAEKEAKFYGMDELAEVLNKIKLILEELEENKLIKIEECIIKKEEFYNKVNKIKNYYEIILGLESLAEIVRDDKKRSYCGSVANFLSSWTGQDEGFVRILKKGVFRTGSPYINLSYQCLDPSLVLKSIVNGALSCIFMSGTLLPTKMYEDLFGIKDAIKREYKNPFPEENRLNIIVKGVTTKFTERNSEMYEKIAKKIQDIIKLIPGNCLVFFPSYEIRDDISNFLETDRKLLFEDINANKDERNELLKKFRNSKNSVLLAISSGSFGEGIDLPGIIKAVIIVGLPLPKPDLETKALIDYYDQKFGRGWEYGYIFPAVIRALQNAGRCIRSETDKGVIIFLEERYSWKNYSRCFPQDLDVEVVNDPEKLIKDFFN